MSDRELDEVEAKLLARVDSVIQELLEGQPHIEIVMDTDLRTIDLDSLERMNFWFSVEEEFGVKVAEEDIDPLSLVSSLIAFLKAHG
jgi:acyl carrier protein